MEILIGAAIAAFGGLLLLIRKWMLSAGGSSQRKKSEGKDYEYRIDKIRITGKNDRTVIVKKKPPTLSLSTCYLFDYIGHAPNRYIVQGYLVKRGNLLN